VAGQVVGDHLTGESKVDREVGVRDADVAPDLQQRVEVSEQLESVEIGVARVGQPAPVCLRTSGQMIVTGPSSNEKVLRGAGVSAWSNPKSSPSSS
jgi:hypothetical protein